MAPHGERKHLLPWSDSNSQPSEVEELFKYLVIGLLLLVIADSF